MHDLEEVMAVYDYTAEDIEAQLKLPKHSLNDLLFTSDTKIANKLIRFIENHMDVYGVMQFQHSEYELDTSEYADLMEYIDALDELKYPNENTDYN